MLRPARLLLAALALVTLSPAAHAEETSPRAPADSHARARARHHRHRRARVDEPAVRAPRSGATGHEATSTKVTKHAPAEKPESIGSPNDGHLKGGAHVDLSKPYFRVVPAYESGDVRWALPVMLNMIDRAARAVHKRFPGAVLDIGDLSQKGGGDLLRHHSHESGRDADLGFYAVDAKGKQIHGRTFVKFDTQLASPNYPGARFDLARNWAFVAELLTDPSAHVSHIFIAEWLRHELLAYARGRASREVQERAALTMMQPHNSLPHDDHFHVRISCPHEAHSSCIELAKAAPSHGHARVAHKTHPGGGHPLRTPGTHLHPAGHAEKAPPASAAVPQDPFVVPAPVVVPDDAEPDADGKDEGDDGGGKMTD